MAKQTCVFTVFSLVLLHTIVNINAVPTDKTSALVSKLLGKKSKEPVVILIEVDKKPTVPDFEDISSETEEEKKDVADEKSNEEVNQEAVKMLHEIVKSPDREDEDTETLKAKQALRQGLIARCGQVNRCMRKCPPKKVKCVITCQEVYDEENLCDEPPPCTKKTCGGKTMPPRWLL